MRVLTVRNPWAWALIHGGKTVENRPRNIAGEYRGPVAIQAGLAWDVQWSQHATVEAMRSAFAAESEVTGEPFATTQQRMLNRRGEILGVVDLVDVHLESDCWTAIALRDGGTHDEHCSPWGDPHDSVHLVFANPRPISERIPFRGNLGLQRLDEATAIQVWEAIA